MLNTYSQQAPSAGLEGTVVKYKTGELLSKATLELQGPSETLTTTTEADGKFYFPNLPPGTYRLRASRDGYWRAEYGQRWVDGPGQAITLGPGQRIPNVQMTMTPGGVISGRITDRFGQPLVGARVRAMKPWIQENQRVLRVVQEVVANDLGEYRLVWLLPGRYYISATYVDFPGGAQLVINPDAGNSGPNASRSVSRPVTSKPLNNTGIAEDEVYAPVYFPATPDGDRAVAIDLPTGAEYRDADITLLPTHTYHVRGLVTDLPPPAPTPAPQPGAGGPRGRTPQTQARLTPLTPNGSLYATPVNTDTGLFDFPKVVPAPYVAYLFLNGLTVRSNVEVRSGDVDGILLPITDGVNIPVSVSFEGQPPPNLPDIRGLRPTLWRDPTLLNAPAMPATAGASLALQNIAPGDYRVYVPPIFSALTGANPVVQPQQWQGAYVKSIRMGDVDVLNAGLHFRSQPDLPLNVVIGTNPGTLEGRVVNESRELIPGAVVTLFADDPSNRIYRTDMYKVTSTDTSGRFQVKGLPPGDYKVFAWDGIENGSWMDTNFLNPYERIGQRVHVDEGKTSNVDLPVIGKQ